jgi:thiol-disulfide isomerase/thioredoxin
MIRFLLCTLVMVTALGAQARAELKAGQPADFDGRSLSGGAFKLSSLRGRVVLVDFWASWCEPCKKELPLLAKLAPRLKQKGVEIVAINIDDNQGNAERFLKEHGLRLTVVFDGDKKIVGKFEPPKMPSSFAVDKAGVVRAVNTGFETGDEAKIETQLLDLAKK